MSDIRIIRGRYRSVVIPVTDKGAQWVVDNIVLDKQKTKGGETILSVNEEFTYDLAEEIKKEGLEVEVK